MTNETLVGLALLLFLIVCFVAVLKNRTTEAEKQIEPQKGHDHRPGQQVSILSKSAIAQMLERLNSNEWLIRGDAAKALANVKDDTVIEALIMTLHEELRTMERVLRNLSMVRGSLCMEFSRYSYSNSRYVAINVIKTLATIGDARVFDPLAAALRTDVVRSDSDIWMEIFYAFGKLGEERAIEYIAVALDLPEPVYRKLAVEEISKIGGKKAMAVLLRAIEHEGDEEVRAKMRTALEICPMRELEHSPEELNELGEIARDASSFLKAAELFRKAADQGFAKAQNNLGALYDTGRGVPQDHKKAATWYCKAADGGDVLGQANLARFYYKGKGGIPLDHSEAARWWRKAAEAGDVDSQYCLAQLYTFGEGVPQDHTEAAKWYCKAAGLPPVNENL